MSLNIFAKRLSTIAIYALGASTVPLIQRVMRNMEMDDDDVNDDPIFEEDFADEDDVEEASELTASKLWRNMWLNEPQIKYVPSLGGGGIAFHSEPGAIKPSKNISIQNKEPEEVEPTVPIKVRTTTNADLPFRFKIEDGVVVVNVVEGYTPMLNQSSDPDENGCYTVEIPESYARQLRALVSTPTEPHLRSSEAWAILQISRVSTSAYKDTDSGYRMCKYMVPDEEMGNIVYPEGNDKIPNDYEYANVPKNPYGSLCTHPERIKRVTDSNVPLIACTEIPNNSVCNDYSADTAVPVKVKLTNGTEADGIRVRTLNPFDRTVRAEVFANDVRITDANYELIATEDDQVDDTTTENSPLRSIIGDRAAV